MTDVDLTELIDVRMTRGQALSLARLARGQAARHRRQLAKSTFVPEPGHRNAAEVALERTERLQQLLLDVAGVEELDDGRPNLTKEGL